MFDDDNLELILLLACAITLAAYLLHHDNEEFMMGSMRVNGVFAFSLLTKSFPLLRLVVIPSIIISFLTLGMFVIECFHGGRLTLLNSLFLGSMASINIVENEEMLRSVLRCLRAFRGVRISQLQTPARRCVDLLAPAFSRREPQASSSMECIVCMSNERDRVFVPCMHVVCCSDCSARMNSCPVCSASYIAMKVFI